MHPIKSTLNRLKSQNLLRQRKIIQSPQQKSILMNGVKFLNFSSNDYLGLANHPKVVEAMISGVKKYGAGAGSSHLITGHSDAHEQLEYEFSQFFGTERALLFGSGYLANIGVISSLLQRNDCLIQDKLNHASLLDGGQLSQAKMVRFLHKDYQQLEKILANNSRQNIDNLVTSDAVFSMDGDVADVQKLNDLCQKYQSKLLVDEAHSFGILGKNGRGLCHQINANNRPIIMATCGKSLGSVGAVVAGDTDLIEFLIQRSRPYIYTTALPASIAHGSIIALKLLKNADEKRHHLTKLIQYFKTHITNIIDIHNLDFKLLPSDTPIQPILLKDNQRAVAISEFLLQNKILVQAIRPPTVPKNTARLRITLSADHHFDDIDRLLSVLQKYSGVK